MSEKQFAALRTDGKNDTVDQNLIAGILLGDMIPVTPPLTLNKTTGKFDIPSVLNSGKVVELAIKMYQGMVNQLNHSKASTESRSETMKKHDEQQSHAPNADQTTPITGAAGQEIIAAIITAGMLPTLPVPKLHRLAAEPLSEGELRPAAEIVASALNLYTNVLHTIRYAKTCLKLETEIYTCAIVRVASSVATDAAAVRADYLVKARAAAACT